MTLHISLPTELENLVHHEVKSGMYGSASEVVREALRDFFDTVAGRQLKDFSEIRAEVQESVQRYETGEDEAIDGEKFFMDMKLKHGLDD